MTQNFLACDRDQVLLMPVSLQEWLPEDHLAWFMLESVAEMDLSAFYVSRRQDGHGRAAHDPEMMVALLMYAYAKRRRSSRGIERKCIEDIAYRVIAANCTPDHATVARFVVRYPSGAFGARPRALIQSGARSSRPAYESRTSEAAAMRDRADRSGIAIAFAI